MLNFAAGMVLGALALRRQFLPPVAAGIALAAGFLVILFVPPVLPRFLSWGVPAVLVVAGTLGLEAPLRLWLPNWLLRLGDASYSIYLTHGFCLAALSFALRRVAPSLALTGTLAAGLALCAMIGWLAYRFVERPLLNGLKRRPSFGVAERGAGPDPMGGVR